MNEFTEWLVRKYGANNTIIGWHEHNYVYVFPHEVVYAERIVTYTVEETQSFTFGGEALMPKGMAEETDKAQDTISWKLYLKDGKFIEIGYGNNVSYLLEDAYLNGIGKVQWDEVHCDFGHSTHCIVKMVPFSNGNIITCYAHFLSEKLGDYTDWQNLPEYDGDK